MKKYIDLYRKTRKVDDEVLDIVDHLRKSGYVVSALSNTSPEKMEAAKKIGANVRMSDAVNDM